MSNGHAGELITVSQKWIEYVQTKYIRHVLSNRKSSHIFALLDNLDKLRPGHRNANAFRNLVADIFDAIFEGDLKSVGLEVELDDGLKRIDILYRNHSEQPGLFHDLRMDREIRCFYIPVECKNYSVDPSNPEIDQLVGRFSEIRGRFGFLVCNRIVDRRRLLRRCKESANAKSGWIIVLDCDDLAELLSAKLLSKDLVWELLYKHFDNLSL